MDTICLAFIALLLGFPLTVESRSPENTKFLRQRDPCTALAQGFEALDDTPAINEAIKNCGNGGTIVLPQDQAYSIRSPIDFSPCKACEVHIEGQLYLSRDYHYWGGSDSVFTLADVHGAKIISKTGKGLIDGLAINYYTSFSGSAYGNKYWKFLFHVTNRSSDITIAGLTIRNPIHGFFLTRGNSSNIHYMNLNLSMEQQWGHQPYNEGGTFGFQIGQSSNVFVDNIDAHFSRRNIAASNSPIGVCASVDIGAHNVVARNFNCRGAWGGALIQVGSIRPAIRGVGLGQITFSNWTIDHIDNDTANAATGFKNYHMPIGRPWDTHADAYNGGEISNITWDGIAVRNGEPTKADFCYMMMRNDSPFSAFCPANLRVDVRDVAFENFVVGREYHMPAEGWGNFNNWSSVSIKFADWKSV